MVRLYYLSFCARLLVFHKRKAECEAAELAVEHLDFSAMSKNCVLHYWQAEAVPPDLLRRRPRDLRDRSARRGGEDALRLHLRRCRGTRSNRSCCLRRCIQARTSCPWSRRRHFYTGSVSCPRVGCSCGHGAVERNVEVECHITHRADSSTSLAIVYAMSWKFSSSVVIFSPPSSRRVISDTSAIRFTRRSTCSRALHRKRVREIIVHVGVFEHRVKGIPYHADRSAQLVVYVVGELALGRAFSLYGVHGHGVLALLSLKGPGSRSLYICIIWRVMSPSSSCVGSSSAG